MCGAIGSCTYVCTHNLKLVQDKAFADGGLDPITDDSDDDVPLGHRMTKPMKA